MSETDTTRRIFVVEATGTDAVTLETDALQKAQSFFGPGVPLTVKPDYIVMAHSRGGYFARVVIYAS